MYVCHCKVVTDRSIRHAIACGARDVRAIAALCGGAGDDCGGCIPVIEELLAEHAAGGGPRAAVRRQCRRPAYSH